MSEETTPAVVETPVVEDVVQKRPSFKDFMNAVIKAKDTQEALKMLGGNYKESSFFARLGREKKEYPSLFATLKETHNLNLAKFQKSKEAGTNKRGRPTLDEAFNEIADILGISTEDVKGAADKEVDEKQLMEEASE